MASEYVTIKRAAEILGVSEVTLRRWDERGVLRPERDAVSNYRQYRLSALHAFSRTAPAPLGPRQLPPPAGEFIGRVAELRDLEALVRTGVRLITIVGPPGVGKTRLAIEAARHIASRPDDGAMRALFCDLSEAQTVDDLCGAVSRCIGLTLTGAEAVGEIGRAMQGLEPTVLVLDNFEQLVAQAPATVARWVAGSFTMLATSRQPLRLAVEQVLSLEPLAVPAAHDDVWSSEAGQLFLARARAVRPGYGQSEPDAVAEIVRRLEGIPLAIELAAALISVRSATDVARRLEQQVASLASVRRDAPARHATLRAAIEWSLAQLSELERRALAQASVFCGGFDLEAARAVIDLPAGASVDEIVAGLREKSLLRAYEAGGGTPRLALYESVREVARELLAAELRDAVFARHAAHYVDLAWRSSREMALGERAEPGDRLAEELENLLEVHRRSPSARLALALDALLSDRGPGPLRLGVLDAVLRSTVAQLNGVDTAMCRIARSHARRRAGDLDGARADLELASATMAPEVQRRVTEELGVVATLAGDAREGRGLLERARDLYAAAGDARGEGRTQNSLGLLAKWEQRFHDAEQALERAVALFREVGDRYWEGNVLSNLGSLHVQLAAGNPLAEYRRALGIARSLGARRLQAHLLANLGNALHDGGDLAQAREHYGLALACLELAPDRMAQAICTGNLGLIDWELGDPVAAGDRLEQAYLAFRDIGNPRGEQFYLGLAAACLAASDRAEAARTMLARMPQPIAPDLIQVIELFSAQLDLAAARQREREGAVDEVAQVWDRVREQLRTAEASSAASEDLRTAIRLLRSALASTPGQ